jgi:Mn2+/Fe2+ NRAMP family transporter
MTNPDPSKYTTEAGSGSRFRKTLIRVMAVQIVSLILLWILQRHYTR